MEDSGNMDDISDAQAFLRREQQNRVLSENHGTLFDIISDTLQGIQNFKPEDVQKYMKDHEAEFMLILCLVESKTPVKKEDESEKKYKLRLKMFFDEAVENITGSEAEKFSRLYTYAVASYLNVPLYNLSRNEFGKYSWDFYPCMLPNTKDTRNLSYITMTLIHGKYYKVTSHCREQDPPKTGGIKEMCQDVLKDSENMDDISDAQMFLESEQENRLLSKDQGTLFDIVSDILEGIPHFKPDAVQTYLKENEAEFILNMCQFQTETPKKDNDESEGEYKLRLKKFFDEAVENITGSEAEKFLRLYTYAVASYLNVPVYILSRNESGKYSWDFYPCILPNIKVPRFPSYITMTLIHGKCYKVTSHDRTQGPPKAEGIVGMCLGALKENLNDFLDAQMFLEHEKENRKVSKTQGTLFDIVSDSLQGIWHLKSENVQKYMKENEAEFILNMCLLENETHVKEEDESKRKNELRLKMFFDEAVENITGSKAGYGAETFSRLYTYAVASYLNVPVYILSQNEFGKYSWAFYPCILPNTKLPRFLSYLTMTFIHGKYYKVTSHDRTQGPPKTEGVAVMCFDVAQENKNDFLDAHQMFLESEQENRVMSKDQGTLFDTVSDILQGIQDFKPEDVQTYMKENEAEFKINMCLVESKIPVKENDELKKNHKDQMKKFFDEAVESISWSEAEKFSQLFTYAVASYLDVPVYILSRNEFGKYSWDFYPCILPNTKAPRSVSYITMTRLHGKYCKVTSHERNQKPPKADGIVGMCIDVSKGNAQYFKGMRVPTILINKCKGGKLINHQTDVCELLSNTNIVTVCRSRLEDQGLELPGDSHRVQTEEVVNLCLKKYPYFVIFFEVLLMRHNLEIIELLSGDEFEAIVASNECSFLQRLVLLKRMESNLIERKSPVDDLTSLCKTKSDDLTKRRGTLNKIIVGSSASGILGGISGIVGLALVPVTFGTSIILTFAGVAVGGISGLAGGFFRGREAFKQNSDMKTVKKAFMKISDLDTELNNVMQMVQEMFCASMETDPLHSAEVTGISLRGFLAIGSAFRSSHTIRPFAFALDIAFLGEAAYNAKKNKNKTNAGEMLKKMAIFLEMKEKIIHSMLRGNTDVNTRLLKCK